MATIFITGSTTGLGFLTAQQLIADGHTVTLHARTPQRAAEVHQRLPRAAHVLVGDLADPAAVKELAHQANQLGTFDAIIHNAGINHALADTLFQVNAVAPYLLTAWLHRPRRLVFVSSIMHHDAPLDLAHLTTTTTYGSSKLQVLLLMTAIARRWPDVIATAVHPGWVPTRMGGDQAPDDLTLGYTTQTWLATTAPASVSGQYFFHQTPAEPDPRVADVQLQEAYLAQLAHLTGVVFPK